MSAQADQLRTVKSFQDLVRYLEERLDWPLQEYGFEELTFEYSPEELGLKQEDVAKVRRIHQLRPLQHGQPWGIFFVEFERKKLPVVVLRRILGHLVVKKRAAANRANAAAWDAADLLFISAYGDEQTEQREIAFAHFHQEAGDLPTLRVLGWDGADTPLKLDHVAAVLDTRLRWPDDPTDHDGWRAQWSSAFRHRLGHEIRTADALAEILASLARSIRAAAITLLKLETERGALRSLHKAFQTALIHDLTEESFADTYAQTITYGLLTAAISRTEMSEGRYGTVLQPDDMASLVPVTNPFLKEMLETFLKVGGRKGGIDFDELGIQEVVALLRGDETNLPAILRDFGNKTQGEDPVIHFYEHFLAAYDKQLKIQRGVFYTPKPVVSYIVRNVHELLQSEFGLADGLADTTTWGEMAQRLPELKIPEGTDPSSPFVVILDPATGTATFLVEVIDVIYRTLTAKWRTQGMSEAQRRAAWNDYVPKHLLPRLYGYELMMAPYAIAHMKIGLKLYETGYRFGSDERVRVYLTNALEPADDVQKAFEGILPALAHESEAVNKVKRTQRFTVIIGNPPYSGVSSNRNEWSEGLLKGKSLAERALANYYEIDGKPLGEKKLWLRDDYVKFMRLSHYLLEQTLVGVHGMITNHSYLDSPTCRGMRFQLLRHFSTLFFLDLHGSTKRQEIAPDGLADENIFDILPGTAISVCARNGQDMQGRVHCFDLWGTMSSKSNWLFSHNLNNVNWNILIPASPYYLFAKRQLDYEQEYHKYFSLKDVFPLYGTGVQTSRDEFATDFDRQQLESRLECFFDLTKTDTEVINRYGLTDTRGWKVNTVRRMSDFGKVSRSITEYLFRVFDRRWIALTKDVVDWPRAEIMSCVAPNRLGLLCSRQQATPGFRHAFVVNGPVDMFCISNRSREGQTLFPLFAPNDRGLFDLLDSQWKINLGDEFSKALTELLSAGARSEPEGLTEEDAIRLLHYVYSILYSSDFRERYIDLLKMDYPRIPLTSAPDLYDALSRLGGALVSLHVIDFAFDNETATSSALPRYPRLVQFSGTNRTIAQFPSAAKAWSNGYVGINASSGFEGVPEEVWNFHIGGYQVCHKWLKDRKDRTLSDEDILHYAKIVTALHETIRIMDEIDAVIDDHGGWPLQ